MQLRALDWAQYDHYDADSPVFYGKSCFGQVSIKWKRHWTRQESVEVHLYNRYSPNDGAKIGKYAAENGASKAAIDTSRVNGGFVYMSRYVVP